MNGNFDDDEAIQNEKERNKSGILQGVDHFSSTQERGIYGEKEKTPRGLNGIQDDKINKKDQADIDAINNRGKNQSTDINGKKKKNKDGDDNESSSSSSSGKKDELESKDGSKDKDSKDKEKDKNKDKEKSSGNNKEEKGELFSSLGKKKEALILKIKIYFWIAVVALAIFLLFFLISFFIMAFDNLTSSLSTFFGVSENGTTECEWGEGDENCENDGLFTDNKYQNVKQDCDINHFDIDKCACDPEKEDCRKLDSDELTKVLMSETIEACDINSGFKEFWDNVDAFFNGGKFKDTCSLLRYIRKNIEMYQNEFSVTLDEGLIVANIFYGYAEQETYKNYENNVENADYKSATEHYKVLIDIIKDGKLKREDIDRIIQNSIFEEVYPYWKWKITEDEDGKLYGSCNLMHQEVYRYSLDKWKLFMRWGDEIDNDYNGNSRNEFSTAGYMGIKKTLSTVKLLDRESPKLTDGEITSLYGSGWVYDTNMTSAYNSTDEECNGTYTAAELKSKYNLAKNPTGVEGSKGSRTFFLNRNITGPIDTSHYQQKVQEINSNKKDTFNPKSVNYFKSNLTIGTYTINYDYRDGFAYINYPLYKSSIDNPDIDIKYDEITTNKAIEQIIEEIVVRKVELNEVLLSQDLDSEGIYSYYTNGIINPAGVTGAACQAYIPADYSKLQVIINDCDGNYLLTTDFKDYIIGVTYGEIDYTTLDAYAQTQMVAEISFALNRRQNYKYGSPITMKSGNCDQVYCSPTQGCYSKKTNSGYQSYYPGSGTWKPVMSSDKLSRYGALFDEAANYLLIGNNNVVFEAGYNATESQAANNRYLKNYKQSAEYWRKQAENGYSFTEILSDTFEGKAKLIECQDSSNDVFGGNVNNNYDYSAQQTVDTTDEYPKKSPSIGNFYGFPYKEENDSIIINPDWVSKNIVDVSTNCSNGNWSKTYKVNKAVKNNFEQAFKNVCKLLTDGIDGCKLSSSDLIDGSTYTEKKTSSGMIDIHSYGLAQDWNYSAKYTISGKTYTPYDSSKSRQNYNLFISEALDGKENDCQNINYVLWKYAYGPAGFKWFGNNKDSSYDGMHFEIDYNVKAE